MQDWPWIKPVCSPNRSGLQRTHILMRSAADAHSWDDKETRACSPNPTLSPSPSPSLCLGTPESSQSLLSVKHLLSHFPAAHRFPASAPHCSLSSGLNVIPSPSTSDLISKHYGQPLPSLPWILAAPRAALRGGASLLCLWMHNFHCPGKQHGQAEPGQGERVLPEGTRPPDFSFQALAIISICHGR